MAHIVTCTRCRQTLRVPDDAPATGLACPRCLAPLSDHERAEIQTAPTTPGLPSTSRVAAEEFVHQGRRDTFLGGAAIGGLVLLWLLGLVLLANAGGPSSEGLLFVFGGLDLVVVVLVSVWLTRRQRPHPFGGCAVVGMVLAVLIAGRRGNSWWNRSS